jgi:hypothetical protein
VVAAGVAGQGLEGGVDVDAGEHALCLLDDDAA